MPLANKTAARDELLTMVNTVAVAESIKAIYDDVPDDLPDSVDYLQVLVVHQTGRQASLANNLGKRRYRKTGLLTIQLFAKAGDGMTTSDDKVQAFEDAFEGKESPSGMWFRNVFSNEFGKVGNRTRTDIFISFEYDLIK